MVNVGIGAVEPGQISGTIGTSGALRMLTRQPKTDPQMRTWCYNLTDDMWVAGGAINNGGMILRLGPRQDLPLRRQRPGNAGHRPL